LILKHFNVRRVLHSGLPGPKLYQNCIKTPLLSRGCIKMPSDLVGLAVQLQQRLTLHLQLHLGVLLEHHRIALPE